MKNLLNAISRYGTVSRKRGKKYNKKKNTVESEYNSRIEDSVQ